MTAHPLPVSSPAAQGVDARGVQAFLDAIEAAPGVEPHGLMILRHGRVVASGWWAPFTADRPHRLYSISKSFTGSAVGFAIEEGLLDLDARVISYFPEFDADITDPGSRAMKVRHIASMASGHLSETVVQAHAIDAEEPVRGFLLIPPDREPGSVFAYNQPTTYTLGAIIQRATGQTLTEYLRPRLLDPLGIGETLWERDRAGRELGYSGLHAATDAVARLGQLYLDKGVWEGEQLLPASWVAQATRAHVDNSDGSPEARNSDWAQGYGFQFWMSRHGYRGDGAVGQFCVVLPEQDVVIAITANTDLMQSVMDMIWEHLLPAFGPEPVSAAGQDAAESAEDAALRERLSRLVLPTVEGEAAPADTEAWSGVRFAPRDGEAEAQPSLTAVQLTADGDGWILTLDQAKDEDEPPFALRFAGTGWAVAERPAVPVPTAVSAGWTDADTFVAELGFLETPHHLTLTCSLAARDFTASWQGKPLRPTPLSSFGVPR
ncbi:serine hydrolase domain-containing protein [Streptomyces sp. NPDC008079]|uniref:serine hydrolase domain-containing protein n=1 Tax=Streptomyces sp. NPDC008079 TaxID=3364806 RepID=UPI0036EC0120